MKIKTIKEAESCANGNVGYDIFFDAIINDDFARYLGKLGKYIVISEFDKPYFKVIVRGYYTLKGTIGNDSLRMLVPETIEEEILNDFSSYVDNFFDN